MTLRVTKSKLKNEKLHFDLLTQSQKLKRLLRVTNSIVKLFYLTFELLARSSKIKSYTSSY